jgi:hypothetical protein
MMIEQALVVGCCVPSYIAQKKRKIDENLIKSKQVIPYQINNNLLSMLLPL